MKKQLLLAISGLTVVLLLFFFGKTHIPQKTVQASVPVNTVKQFDIQQFINDSSSLFGESARLELTQLNQKLTTETQSLAQAALYTKMADLWKDSVHIMEGYLYFTSKSAKLENSEKSLTFAAQLFLEVLRGESEISKINWLTDEAIALYEQAILVNPSNDELKIGLGSCYIYGKGRNGDPQETMKGIQTLLEVARRDSNNMHAQMVLGVGGLISGQYDKALERLQKVVLNQPDNLEAIAYLADAYAAKGNKEEAVKWYNISKRLANNPHYTKEVDERINNLK